MAITNELMWDGIDISVDLRGQGGEVTLSYVSTSDDPDNDEETDVILALEGDAPDFYQYRYSLYVKSTITIKKLALRNAVEIKWLTEVKYTTSSNDDKPDTKDYDPQTVEQRVTLSIRTGGSGSLQLTDSTALGGTGLVEQMLKDPDKYDMITQFGGELEHSLGLEPGDKDAAGSFKVVGMSISTQTIQVVVKTFRRPEEVNAGYLVTAASAARDNVVNSSDYKGFAATTLKLVDFEASQRGGENAVGAPPQGMIWDLTFVFDFSPVIKAGDFQIGSLPANTKDIGGQDYIDVMWVPEPKTWLISSIPSVSKEALIPVPVRAAIHKIHPEVDFNALLYI